jgi:8-oxo-dGTP pyrophosphatase MutT (NUDIX family)
MQPDDEDARASREVRAVLPQRPVRRVVVGADLYLLDLSIYVVRCARIRRPQPHTCLTMSDERPSAWHVTESMYVIDTPHLRLRKDTILLPNGQQVNDFYVRETRGFVVMFAITPDDQVIFTREYRHGFGTHLLGLPGGQINEGELPHETARRELGEETGYAGETPEFVKSFIIAPVNSDGEFHVYVIRNARPSIAQSFDVTEDIVVELYPLGELRDMVREGTIRISHHAVAIYATLDHLGKL